LPIPEEAYPEYDNPPEDIVIGSVPAPLCAVQPLSVKF